MSDQYVDEIRAIRDRQYEETKNMTPEERAEYTRIRVEAIQLQLEELRHEEEVNQQPVKTGH